MPDLFEDALLALFFLLLLRERIVAALVVLALAFMTRENTLVLCLVLACSRGGPDDRDWRAAPPWSRFSARSSAPSSRGWASRTGITCPISSTSG